MLAEYSAKIAAHEADPTRIPHPGGAPFNYNFFLPTDEASATNLRKKLDVDDHDRDNPDLYTAKNRDGKEVFRLERQRTYETGRATAQDPDHAYKEIALALHDPDLDVTTQDAIFDPDDPSQQRLKKGAYYYPIMQKIQLKPHRSKNLAQLGGASRFNDEDDDKRVDAWDVIVDDLDDNEKAKRSSNRAALLGEEEDAPDDDS
ncbi:MAG: hypothetical protein L6R42_011261 [Xanthoria sp. 1 TBL-2021]|nr:MAG: hypothetical protein L6R42_011261 [Xanthoria sp. 1 TBL-2021]